MVVKPSNFKVGVSMLKESKELLFYTKPQETLFQVLQKKYVSMPYTPLNNINYYPLQGA